MTQEWSQHWIEELPQQPGKHQLKPRLPPRVEIYRLLVSGLMRQPVKSQTQKNSGHLGQGNVDDLDF